MLTEISSKNAALQRPNKQEDYSEGEKAASGGKANFAGLCRAPDNPGEHHGRLFVPVQVVISFAVQPAAKTVQSETASSCFNSCNFH